MLQRAKKIERAIRFRSANSDSLIHNLSVTLLLYAKKERMSIENAKILEKGKKAYIKKKAEKKKAEDFGPRLKGWKFWSKKDKDTVIEIIEKNNKKRKGG